MFKPHRDAGPVNGIMQPSFSVFCTLGACGAGAAHDIRTEVTAQRITQTNRTNFFIIRPLLALADGRLNDTDIQLDSN
jgi:hypothetical protein